MYDNRDAMPTNPIIECPYCGGSLEYGEVFSTPPSDEREWLWSCIECDAIIGTISLLRLMPELTDQIGPCARWVEEVLDSDD